MKKFFSMITALLLASLFAEASISIVGGLTKRYDVKKGARLADMISIKNDAVDPAEVKIYQTDYVFFADGVNQYGEPGKEKRSNALWIKLNEDRIIVPPNGIYEYKYNIAVPESTDLDGSYWSMIMVEPISKQSLESSLRENEGMGLMTQIRFAVQIISNIENTGQKKINFIQHNLFQTEDGKYFFQSDVENTGNLELSPKMYLEFYDVAGNMVRRFEGKQYRIYPGCSIRYLVDVSGVPLGQYTVVIVMDNEDDFIVGDRVRLEIS